MKSRISLTDQERTNESVAEGRVTQAIEFFELHGALWIENVFSKQFIESLANAYTEKYISLGKAKLNRRHATVGNRRFMVTVALESPFNSPELYANPLLMPILCGLLSDWCTIASFGSVVTFPHADPQLVHLDHPPLYESDEISCQLPPHAITLVVPLVDVDATIGSTAIWEGSHRDPQSRAKVERMLSQPTWEGSTFPTAKKGDVYMMDYRVVHGGMANDSDQPRPILYIVYGRPWFRDGFNFLDQAAIDISMQEYANLPATHRHLFAAARPHDFQGTVE